MPLLTFQVWHRRALFTFHSTVVHVACCSKAGRESRLLKSVCPADLRTAGRGSTQSSARWVCTQIHSWSGALEASGGRAWGWGTGWFWQKKSIMCQIEPMAVRAIFMSSRWCANLGEAKKCGKSSVSSHKLLLYSRSTIFQCLILRSSE